MQDFQDVDGLWSDDWIWVKKSINSLFNSPKSDKLIVSLYISPLDESLTL